MLESRSAGVLVRSVGAGRESPRHSVSSRPGRQAAVAAAADRCPWLCCSAAVSVARASPALRGVDGVPTGGPGPVPVRALSAGALRLRAHYQQPVAPPAPASPTGGEESRTGQQGSRLHCTGPPPAAPAAAPAAAAAPAVSAGEDVSISCLTADEPRAIDRPEDSRRRTAETLGDGVNCKLV